jgi:hypothetical protein
MATSFRSCDAETQDLIVATTFEDLITTNSGMLISRALVNVVIDQQIGQQISVWKSSMNLRGPQVLIKVLCSSRWIPSAKFYNIDAARSAVLMM